MYPEARVIGDRISATAIASSLLGSTIFTLFAVVFRRRDPQRLSLVDLGLVERDREQCASRVSLRRRQIRRSSHHRNERKGFDHKLSAKQTKYESEEIVGSRITVKFRNPEKDESVTNEL